MILGISIHVSSFDTKEKIDFEVECDEWIALLQ